MSMLYKTFFFNTDDAVTAFVRSLDALAARHRPDGAPDLSEEFTPIFSGEEPADSATGYALIHNQHQKCDAEGYKVVAADASDLLNNVVVTAMHCAAEAVHAESLDEAVIFLCNAHELYGYALGITWAGDKDVVLSNLAKKGAEGSRAAFEPRVLALYAWCDENFSKYRSVSAAAQVVSLKVHMAVKTAVKHINEWKKQNSW